MAQQSSKRKIQKGSNNQEKTNHEITITGPIMTIIILRKLLYLKNFPVTCSIYSPYWYYIGIDADSLLNNFTSKHNRIQFLLYFNPIFHQRVVPIYWLQLVEISNIIENRNVLKFYLIQL